MTHKYNSLPSRSIEHGFSMTSVLITALLFHSSVAQAIELGEAMNATVRVLVVDDNIDTADMTAEVLRMHGISVVVAYGGLEALETARLVIPSVIVLDVGMPVMNGCEVAAALRKKEVFQQVKLVALTAWAIANRASERGLPDLIFTSQNPLRLPLLYKPCKVRFLHEPNYQGSRGCLSVPVSSERLLDIHIKPHAGFTPETHKTIIAIQSDTVTSNCC